MKAYIQYLHRGVITNKLIEVCGDRGVVILDGRQNLKTWIEDGHRFNGYRRPVYPGFKIMVGNFRNAKEVYSTTES